MSSSSPDAAVGFYSFLRYVADPLRDEAVNVGLFLVSKDGQWARFRPHVTKTRVEAIGRRADVDVITRWTSTLLDAYGLDGETGLFHEGVVDATTLEDWAREAGGMLRLSSPRAAIDSDMEALWTSLWRRYIRRGRGADLVDARSPRALTGAQERSELVKSFVEAAQAAPNFDPARVKERLPFLGTHLTHVADVTIQNGAITAIAQALPFAHGSEVEVIERRSLLVDAALDLPDDVLKLGIYDDPPSDRVEILASTQAFLDVLGRDHKVRLLPRRDFTSLVDEVAPVMFPAHG